MAKEVSPLPAIHSILFIRSSIVPSISFKPVVLFFTYFLRWLSPQHSHQFLVNFPLFISRLLEWYLQHLLSFTESYAFTHSPYLRVRALQSPLDNVLDSSRAVSTWQGTRTSVPSYCINSAEYAISTSAYLGRKWSEKQLGAGIRGRAAPNRPRVSVCKSAAPCRVMTCPVLSCHVMSCHVMSAIWKKLPLKSKWWGR